MNTQVFCLVCKTELINFFIVTICYTGFALCKPLHTNGFFFEQSFLRKIEIRTVVAEFLDHLVARASVPIDLLKPNQNKQIHFFSCGGKWFRAQPIRFNFK